MNVERLARLFAYPEGRERLPMPTVSLPPTNHRWSTLLSWAQHLVVNKNWYWEGQNGQNANVSWWREPYLCAISVEYVAEAVHLLTASEDDLMLLF
jgi:hypothetical protein